MSELEELRKQIEKKNGLRRSPKTNTPALPHSRKDKSSSPQR
ncbi:MAG: hypothetical protein ACYDEJ_06640 [Desulfitobacteriaceae bacterium]